MLIGLTGIKRSGKDTVGDYFTHKYGYTKIAFADPLKDTLKILFHFSDDQLYGDLKETIDERWGITPRHAMQYFGTEIVRNRMGEMIPGIGENFWIKNAEMRIEQCGTVVVTDVRFPNESDLIRKRKGILIRIIRPCLNNMDGHTSETMINDIVVDYEIVNDGTIEDLYRKVDEIMGCVQV